MWKILRLMQFACITSVVSETRRWKYLNVPGQIFDWTKPINALIAEEISVENFINQSGIFLENKGINDTKEISALYDTDCKTFDVCETQMFNVLNMLKKINGTLTQKIDLDLTFTLNINALVNMSLLESNSGLPFWDYEIQIVLYYAEGTVCTELEKSDDINLNKMMSGKIWEQFLSLSSSPKIGVGYTEALIGCKNLTPRIKTSDFAVTYIDFGETVGVPESFAIFKKRMEFMNERNILFRDEALKDHFPPKNGIIYYPTPKSVGDMMHSRLLSKYGTIWSNSVVRKKSVGIITQVPSLEKSIPKNPEFTLMPYIESSVCNYDDNMKWYAPSALQFLSQNFKSVLLTNSELMNLKSENTKDFYSTLNLQYFDNIQLEIFVDYKDSQPFLEKSDIPKFTQLHCSYNWTLVENNLQKFIQQEESYPLQNIKIKGLIFALSNEEDENYTAFVDANFARRMSSLVQIGCSFELKGSKSLNSTNIYTIIEACRKINGSLYVIKSSSLDPNWITEDSTQENYMYYENVVRKQLEAMSTLRTMIKKLHTDAVVYIQPIIKASEEVEFFTIFCNTQLLRLNEFAETILTWAKLKKIPLIFRPAFQFGSSGQSWFSFLIPQPTTEIGLIFADSHPLFVLRNYPQENNFRTVEPCLQRVEGRPTNIENTYFHNYFIGVIFDTDLMRNESRITIEEYDVLLQFTFYRFDLIELIIRNNCQSVMQAHKQLISTNIYSSTKHILINSATVQQMPFSSFLKCTAKVVGAKMPIVNGIHAPIRFNETDIIKSDVLVAKKLQPSLNMGILTDLKHCLGTTSKFVFQNRTTNDKVFELLKSLDYIVCKDEIVLFVDDHDEVIGDTFDTHLYIQRMMKNFQPHLNLYFHIDINLLHGLKQETIARYLRLISNLKNFGSTYNVRYIVVQAFDNEFGDKNGWWNVTNYSDLSNPNSYVEKESVYFGTNMWRPNSTQKPTMTLPKDSKSAYIIAIVLFGVFAMAMFLASYIYLRYIKRRPHLTEEEVKEFINGRLQADDENISDFDLICAAELLKFDINFELSILDITIDTRDVIGRGNFGTVYKGLAKGKIAAIKKPNRDCSQIAFKSVLTEVKVLCYIGEHENVIGFLGAYIKEINKGVLCIATEYCSNGSLEGYLRAKGNVLVENRGGIPLETFTVSSLNLYELHRFAIEIAGGMEYIATKKVVHGDLSTRNVLLNENMTCKIGDFGLSRKLYEHEKYLQKSKEPLPWQWMAYETLTKREFTLKSDVWSYGVTVWEIYSLGSTPYGGLNWTPGFADELQNGLRLTRPKYASEDVYKKMQECWKLDGDLRPTYSHLMEFFKSLCHNEYAKV